MRSNLSEKLEFEQGPIRPPNEARSLLLRITRNCPWNQCLFCSIYKQKKFSLRTVEEIKRDIETAKSIEQDIKELSWRLGLSGTINDPVISKVYNSPEYSSSYKSLALWLYYRSNACFLQDADNLIMKTDDLAEVLTFLREKFSNITRVTTYSRSRTIVRKSLDSLKKLKSAGLDRIHIGLESGYDPLLKYIKKGVTAEQHIEAGKKVIEAGMELSEYVMPGLGGQGMWKEHAISTAEVLNQINPHFIRLRSLRIPAKAPLREKLLDNEFKMQNDDRVVEEIRLFIENLKGISSVVTSDHIMNLLEEVTGRLPEDKEKMLNIISKYRLLPEKEKMIFRLGRRGGAYGSIDDLEKDPVTRKKIEGLLTNILLEKGDEGVERVINEMVDQYI